MSILKSLFRLISSFLFTTFLTMSLLMVSLVEFTEYANFKPFVTDVLSSSLSQQVDTNQASQLHNFLTQNCAKKEFTNFDLGDISIKIKCSELQSTQTKDLLKLLSASLFDSLYYKKYSCSVLDCLMQPGVENLLVLVSENMNNFLKSMQNIIWFLAAAGAMMMYFSVDTLKGRLRTFGVNIAFVGVSFIVFTYAVNFLIPVQNLPIDIKISDIVDSLFGRLSNYFIFMAIVGVLLVISSYLIASKTRAQRKRKK